MFLKGSIWDIKAKHFNNKKATYKKLAENMLKIKIFIKKEPSSQRSGKLKWSISFDFAAQNTMHAQTRQ